MADTEGLYQDIQVAQKLTPYVRLRKMRGLSQEEACEILHVSRRTLIDVEHGTKDASKRLALGMDHLYGCKGKLIEYWLKTEFSFMRRCFGWRILRKFHRHLNAEKALVCAAMITAGVAATGFYSGDQQLVETTYIVQPGDTLWDIAESYVTKNTGGKRYVLEFKSGIEELNPWLLESHDQLQPGQELRIDYWVKGDSANE